MVFRMARAPGSGAPRHPIEELDDAGLQRVFGADDEQALVLDQLLEQLRAMAQVIRRGADVGPHGLLDQCGPVFLEAGREQSLDRGTDAVYDRPQVTGLVLRRPPQLLERGHDGPAARMADDHHEPSPVARGGEFDAADLRGGHDVSGDPNDEQVAQALIEHDLRGNPRVGASEDYGKRPLLGSEVCRPGGAQDGVGGTDVRGEPQVALTQSAEGFAGGTHGFRCVLWMVQNDWRPSNYSGRGASCQPRRLKNSTSRSCFWAAARVANVPRLRRRPVLGFRFTE